MSDDFHRRRRLNGDGPRRTRQSSGPNPWFVTIVAAIVVVAGGWFLGQALARLLNPKPPQTVALITPGPSPTLIASPTMIPSPTVAPSPTMAPTAAPSPTIAPSPTQAPAPAVPPPTPAVLPSAAPAVKPKPTAEPRTVVPAARKPETASPAQTAAPAQTARPAPTAQPATPAPSPKPAESGAVRIVRAYIDALRNGDPQTAGKYLGNGAPDETFIDPTTRILDVRSTENGDGSYDVSVVMQTKSGRYDERFLVSGNGSGARILDRNSTPG